MTDKTTGLPRYRCVSCNETFTVKPGKKPRCPHCMSIHSVEPVEEKQSFSLPPWGKYVIAGVLAIGLCVAGAFLFMHLRTTASPVTLDPAALGAVDPKRMSSYLAEQDIEEENVIDPFVSSEALDTFAEKHKGFGSGQGRAGSLYKALLALKGEGKYKPFVPRQPRKDEIRFAGALLDAIETGDHPEAYSLELALMLAAAARHVGLAAVVAEVVDYPGLQAPLDPSGSFGHFAVAVYDGGSYEGSYVLYDLHQGRTQPDDQATSVPLTDAQVVAQVLGHQAVRLVAVEFDAQESLVKLEDALILDPDAVQLHTMRALIYLTSGGLDEGEEELRKALQIRTDAQRLVKWGAILLADDEEQEAREQIQKAIDLKPDYALAHASLAMALLAAGEVDEARHELDLARSLDPDDPLISVYETNYWMAKQDVAKAMKAAEMAFEKNFHDPQTGLLLAAIYGRAGESQKMRDVLQEIRQHENLPQEIMDLIDAQLGEMSVSLDVGPSTKPEEDLPEDPNIAAILEEDEEDDSTGDKPVLDMPDIGEKPHEGFLTGKGSGLSLSPGGSGLSLKPGGSLLSGQGQ